MESRMLWLVVPILLVLTVCSQASTAENQPAATNALGRQRNELCICKGEMCGVEGPPGNEKGTMMAACPCPKRVKRKHGKKRTLYCQRIKNKNSKMCKMNVDYVASLPI